MTIDHVRLNNILFSVITKICKDMNSLDWGCVRLSYVIYNSLSLEGLKVFKYKNILICVMCREQRSIIFLNMKVSLKCRCTWIVFSTPYGILKTNTLAPSTPLLQILVQSYFFLYLSRLILFVTLYFFYGISLASISHDIKVNGLRLQIFTLRTHAYFFFRPRFEIVSRVNFAH